MKLPRSIDGNRLSLHLERNWEYVRISQKGSHIRLRTQVPSEHTATVPAHKHLKVGTLQGILKDIADHKRVSVEEVLFGF